MDREKVIEELNDSKQLSLAGIGMKYGMAYIDFAQKCIDDVLALLKEQEAVEPKINEDGEAFCECGENVGIIPNNKQLPSVCMKFCPECGKPILWGAVGRSVKRNES